MAPVAKPRPTAMSRLRVALVGLVALSTLTIAVSSATPTGVAEANIPVQIDIATPGPLGPVTVFGDSVLLGSALWGPTLPDRLAEQGWGPIKFRAGAGYHTRSGWGGALDWLSGWRAQGWDAPNVLINLGANDSGICDTDIACARRQIQGVIDEIGPGHTIWWPQITRLFTAFAQQDTWNRGTAGVRRCPRRLPHLGLAGGVAPVPVRGRDAPRPGRLSDPIGADGRTLHPRRRPSSPHGRRRSPAHRDRRTGNVRADPGRAGDRHAHRRVRSDDARCDASDRPGRRRPRRRLGGGPLRRGRAHDIEGVLRCRTVRSAGIGFDRELRPVRRDRRADDRRAGRRRRRLRVQFRQRRPGRRRPGRVRRPERRAQVPAARPSGSSRRHPHDGTHHRARGTGSGGVQRGGGQPHRHPGGPTRVSQCVCLRRSRRRRQPELPSRGRMGGVRDRERRRRRHHLRVLERVDRRDRRHHRHVLRRRRAALRPGRAPRACSTLATAPADGPRSTDRTRRSARESRRRRLRPSRAPSPWSDRSAEGSSAPTPAPAMRRRRRPTPAPGRSWRTRSPSASATPVASVS